MPYRSTESVGVIRRAGSIDCFAVEESAFANRLLRLRESESVVAGRVYLASIDVAAKGEPFGIDRLRIEMLRLVARDRRPVWRSGGRRFKSDEAK
jgi:hypothetical protein